MTRQLAATAAGGSDCLWPAPVPAVNHRTPLPPVPASPAHAESRARQVTGLGPSIPSSRSPTLPTHQARSPLGRSRLSPLSLSLVAQLLGLHALSNTSFVTTAGFLARPISRLPPVFSPRDSLFLPALINQETPVASGHRTSISLESPHSRPSLASCLPQHTSTLGQRPPLPSSLSWRSDLPSRSRFSQSLLSLPLPPSTRIPRALFPSLSFISNDPPFPFPAIVPP
ncbi:hypothetical protein V8E36_004838 [Tilletia maclaganii]